MNPRRTACLALLALSIALAPVLLGGCNKVENSPWPADKNGPRVVTTFAPIYCFATNVVGDDGHVICLLTGTGPHDYAPTPREALKLRGANIFFVNGLDLDDKLATQMLKGADDRNVALVNRKSPRLARAWAAPSSRAAIAAAPV